MNYTDNQLKQALAKMLPAQIGLREEQELYWLHKTDTCFCKVLDTELLHLCWLVEETLDKVGDTDEPIEIRSLDIQWNRYVDCIFEQQDGSAWSLAHATWQQRVIALAKVKGIEI